MNFQLSEEHEMIRKMVRDFAENEVAPTATERDEEARFDMEIWEKMAELGLTGIPWPEEYGGIGIRLPGLCHRRGRIVPRMRIHGGNAFRTYFPCRLAGIINLVRKNKNKNTFVRWRKERKSAHTA